MILPTSSGVLRREALVFGRLWLLLLLSYLAAVTSFDLAFHGWLDLRQDAIARLFYVPPGQALVFQLLTYPRRRKAAAS